MYSRFMAISFILWFCLLCFHGYGSRRWHRHTHHHRHHHLHNSHAYAPSPSNGGHSGSGVIFDVQFYGAVGDGETDDTEAFRTVWDAACDSVSAIVYVPEEMQCVIRPTIFTGPCRGVVIFEVNGAMVAPDGPEAWPEGSSRRQWLVFYRVNDLKLRGEGFIDGKGEKWWDLPCKPHRGPNGTTLPGLCDSPNAVIIFLGSNITVQGLTLINSPHFHLSFVSCTELYIDSINILSPMLSPNTDGIHVENSQNVQIYNSVVSCGDDCVSIGPGSSAVDIKNVTCGPGHGISIGSLGNSRSRACVRNITVRDSLIKGTSNGVRIKTWQGGSGAVSGVNYNGIVMENVRRPVVINQFYCLSEGCPNQTSAVAVSNITYTNVTGTYDVRSPAIFIACSDSVACSNISLWGVELLPTMGTALNPFCWNAYGNSITPTFPPVEDCLLDGHPPPQPPFIGGSIPCS